MRSNKTINTLLVQPNTWIALSTIILWLMAASGWKLALNVARRNYLPDTEIDIPTFYLTLLVLPLPYAAFRLYQYLTQKYPTVNWTARLASSIFYLLLITLVLQVLLLCFIYLIGPLAGGLDLMFPWQFEAVYNSALWGLFATLLTVLITFDREKNRDSLVLSLPAVITYGILFFQLVFISGMSARVSS